MARPSFTPRKRRTRQHVIADQSINHVERFIIEEGHTAQRVEKDYGYDLVLWTFDPQGYAEPGTVVLQVKASEILEESGGDFVFALDIRDYNLWMNEFMPVVLVLFDASTRRAYWLFFQEYFQEASSRQPQRGAKTVRVQVPRKQRVNRRAVATMRRAKQVAMARYGGSQHV